MNYQTIWPLFSQLIFFGDNAAEFKDLDIIRLHKKSPSENTSK